jgi:hypothetical protein
MTVVPFEAKKPPAWSGAPSETVRYVRFGETMSRVVRSSSPTVKGM